MSFSGVYERWDDGTRISGNLIYMIARGVETDGNHLDMKASGCADNSGHVMTSLNELALFIDRIMLKFAWVHWA